MTSKEIKLSDLPRNIQNKIPYSLRSKKDIYELSKLPFNIQYYVKEYFANQLDISYGVVFDITPEQSNVKDFETIDNYYDLVVEYLKNYLVLSKEDYPFDPLFYSRLKEYVQTKDTSLQHTLINNELNRIVRIISADLEVTVQLKRFQIDVASPTDASVVYNVLIQVKVNNILKSLTVSF